MQLSKREYKYRQKIINEFHCNKEEQQRLDEYVKESTIFGTYRKIYNGKNCFCPFYSGVGISRIIDNANILTDSLKNVGICIKDTSGNFKSMGDILNEISCEWNKENH